MKIRSLTRKCLRKIKRNSGGATSTALIQQRAAVCVADRRQRYCDGHRLVPEERAREETHLRQRQVPFLPGTLPHK